MTVARLIDMLKQMHPDSTVNIDVAYVDGDENNTTVLATRRWIPVTEDLPDSDRDVLITVKGRWAPEVGYVIERMDHVTWVACDRGFVFPDVEVVAWMELPPKYEVKDDE